MCQRIGMCSLVTYISYSTSMPRYQKHTMFQLLSPRSTQGPPSEYSFCCLHERRWSTDSLNLFCSLQENTTIIPFSRAHAANLATLSSHLLRAISFSSSLNRCTEQARHARHCTVSEESNGRKVYSSSRVALVVGLRNASFCLARHEAGVDPSS